ncbi:MAG: hypothetical protein NWQ54_18900 [Paraglaciecola sp.]|nr:hypothetical protein [Paraglaciecola sp.]
MKSYNKKINNPQQLELFESDCMGVLIDESFSLDNIVESNSSITVKNFSPDKFNKALRFNRALKIICNIYSLQEYEVEGILKDLFVYHCNKKNLSTEEIIARWDEHHCIAEVDKHDAA